MNSDVLRRSKISKPWIRRAACVWLLSTAVLSAACGVNTQEAQRSTTHLVMIVDGLRPGANASASPWFAKGGDHDWSRDPRGITKRSAPVCCESRSCHRDGPNTRSQVRAQRLTSQWSGNTATSITQK
jgi:hypothetical protein